MARRQDPGLLAEKIRRKLRAAGLADEEHTLAGIAAAFPPEFNARHLGLDLAELSDVFVHLIEAGLIRSRPPVTLTGALKSLASARTLEALARESVRAARALTRADGAAFVRTTGEHCRYVEEDAVEPLWKGQTFPSSICISGWVARHRAPALIHDASRDSRIPFDIYRPTFVRSLAMAPILGESTRGCIGVYWKKVGAPKAADEAVLVALAAAAGGRMAKLGA